MTDAKLTKATIAMLREVEAGHVVYSQYNGGMGAKYENTTKPGRSLRGTDPDSTLGRLIRDGLVRGTTMAVRMGDAISEYPITLTGAGREALASS